MATEKEDKIVRNVLIGFLILAGILYATSPPAKEAIFIYIILASISFFLYKFGDFKDKLIGIRSDGKSVGKSFLYALFFGGGFYLVTRLIPGASIGLPLLPSSIGDSLRFIIIVLFAPIIEEIFFRGVIIGYLRDIKSFKNRPQIPIIIQAVLFALAHIGAYIAGIYQYPNFTSGLSAFNSNIASFISASLFGYLQGFIVTRGGVKNLIFAIISHMIINLIVLTSLSVIFLG